jgi:hypothetical protein
MQSHKNSVSISALLMGMRIAVPAFLETACKKHDLAEQVHDWKPKH